MSTITEIVKCLGDWEWHHVYDFHCKYRLSPGQVFTAINFLKELGLVDVSGEMVRLNFTSNNRGIKALRSMIRDRDASTDCKRSFSVASERVCEYNDDISKQDFLAFSRAVKIKPRLK